MFLKDRIPKYPNRKKIVFEDDKSVRYATIEYADEPLEEGSPLNAFTLDAIVPNGVILMWSGSSADIPDGWALCDGANGTPDLRGRFIVGASDEFENKSTGGQSKVNFKHTHSYSGITKTAGDGGSVRGGDAGSLYSFEKTNHTHKYLGETETWGDPEQSILPPYYALCYIMKITQIAKEI